MADKYLKIIQNGVASFVPDTKRTREFWTKQNSRVSRSNSAQKETVTILTASADEVEFMQQAISVPIPMKAQPAAPVSADVNELKSIVERQQQLIDLLLSNKATESGVTDITSTSQDAVPAEEPAKEKGKPGPKPKNDTNGENQ